MKKIVSLILAATMSTTVLSGCVMSGANEPAESSDAYVSEISTVDESEKEYAETILAQVNERKSKNDENFDGIIIKGIHGRDFFEVLNFRHNDLYLHYSNHILEKLTDYEYISNGRRDASFNQQPSPEELELIWNMADSFVTDSEYEEYKNKLNSLVTKRGSALLKILNWTGDEVNFFDYLAFFGLAYDKISELTDDDIKEMSEKNVHELAAALSEGSPAEERMKQIASYEANVIYNDGVEMILKVFDDIEKEYGSISAEQKKRIFMLRMISEISKERYYAYSISSSYSNLEAQCAGLISPDDEKLTLQKAEEIIDANMDKSDPVEAVLQEFLSVQKYPDWHISYPSLPQSTNAIVKVIGSYYEFIFPGENGTAESIAVIDHSGIVYHKYDADDHLIDEKILLVDFDKNFEYNESERTIHHG